MSANANPRVATNRRLLLEGIVLGAFYGLVLRLLFGNNTVAHWLSRHDAHNVSAIMTIAFLAFGPLSIGFLTVSRAEALGAISIWKWIFAPWISVLLLMAGTALIGWEGRICIVMATPIALVLASVGGIIAGIVKRLSRRRLSHATLSCVAILPFLVLPAESLLATPTQTRTVSSEIRIHASPETVWRNIERVPAISPSESRTTWAEHIGFPRPVEATLSFEGAGGVRHATFEHGVLFVETVTAWQPEHYLAFTIHADTPHIPSTTLDEHVTIGGRYFDVLDGEYRIEQVQNGDVVLHLVSHERLSTDFNGYAGLWTDAVMRSIQTNILQVIKHRCERA